MERPLLFRKDKDVRAERKGHFQYIPENSVHTRTIHIKHYNRVLQNCCATATTQPSKTTIGQGLSRVVAFTFFYTEKRDAATLLIYHFLSQNVRRGGKRQEAEEDQTQGKEDGYGQTKPETGTGRTELDKDKTLTAT
ncbi:hypothetical protein [Phocaeicola sartorii]|uniref:hypothetical protein n=1 Tax=Phocaeicola sartorii TaxID=671267 RepID=UPI003F68C6D4